MTKTKSIYLALVAVLLSPMAVNAEVIDFESLAHDGFSENAGCSYDEDGFNLTNTPCVFEFGVFGSSESRYTGTAAMFNNTVNGRTTLTQIAGGLFDLISIDLAELNGPSVVSVEFFSDFGSQLFTLDGNAFGLETFVFDSILFSGVSFVYWDQVSPFHQFDNIVIDEGVAVPEPGTLALLGLGLVGMAARRKKKV